MALMRTDVSEELSASFVRVKFITLKVTTVESSESYETTLNQLTIRFHEISGYNFRRNAGYAD
jgi:hypothetical protein